MTKVVDKDKFFECRDYAMGLRKNGKGAVMLVVGCTPRLRGDLSGTYRTTVGTMSYVCPMDCGVGPQVRSTRFVV